MERLVTSTTFGGLNVFEFDEQTKVSCISKTDADELPINQRNNIDNASLKIKAPTIWCVRHLPQNPNIFITCGGSGNLRLWQW